MKIVSWNCEKGLTLNKVKLLLNNEKFNGADIYAIQECKESDINSEIEEKLGHSQGSWYGDHKEYEWYRKGDLGIALFSDKFNIERMNTGEELYRYVIPYKITDKESLKSFILIHIWTKKKNKIGNQNEDYLLAVLNAMKDEKYKKFLFPYDNEVVWLGDFNCSYQVRDIWSKEKFKEFDTIITKNLYSSYHQSRRLTLGQEEEMTYFDRKSNSFFNDYIFVGKNSFEITNSCVGSEKGWSVTDCNKAFSSDHCPVMAEIIIKE